MKIFKQSLVLAVAVFLCTGVALANQFSIDHVVGLLDDPYVGKVVFDHAEF